MSKTKNVRIKTWNGVKKGQKFIVYRQAHSHNYPVGKVLTINRDLGCDRDDPCDIAMEDTYNHLHWDCVELVFEVNFSLKELTEKKNDLVSQIDTLDQRIKFCVENGVDEFNEDEFAIYQALDVLDGVGTRQEKAKALADLLNRK